MSHSRILKIGHPLLYQMALPVTAFDQALHDLVDEMKSIMAAANGAGLAAPQIGHLLQVVIFGAEQHSRYPNAPPVPFTILVNPKLTPVGTEQEEDWEGCLSVPGLRGLVSRYRHVRYQGFDEQGQVIDRTVSGFHARVVQHECDHLRGVLYPLRLKHIQHLVACDE